MVIPKLNNIVIKVLTFNWLKRHKLLSILGCSESALLQQKEKVSTITYKFTFSEFPILLVMGHSELGQVVVNFVWAMLALKREENRDECFIWLDRGDKIMRRKT